jgi:hypothetical protein
MGEGRETISEAVSKDEVDMAIGLFWWSHSDRPAWQLGVFSVFQRVEYKSSEECSECRETRSVRK